MGELLEGSALCVVSCCFHSYSLVSTEDGVNNLFCFLRPVRSIDYRGLGKRAEKGKKKKKKGGGGGRWEERGGKRRTVGVGGGGEIVYVCVEREIEREREELDCIYFFKKEKKK